MKSLIPIILEIDEVLNENEEFIGLQTVGIEEGNKRLVGYVALIKDFSGRNLLRYGNLKAIKYDKQKFNNTVL